MILPVISSKSRLKLFKYTVLKTSVGASLSVSDVITKLYFQHMMENKIAHTGDIVEYTCIFSVRLSTQYMTYPRQIIKMTDTDKTVFDVMY
jgi:hypothetical protein